MQNTVEILFLFFGGKYNFVQWAPACLSARKVQYSFWASKIYPVIPATEENVTFQRMLYSTGRILELVAESFATEERSSF